MRLFKKTIKTIIALMLVLSLAAVPVLADEQDDLEERNAELEAQIAEEEAKVEEIQANINDLEEYIAALQDEMDNIRSIIQDYEVEKGQKQNKVDELNATVAELEDKIAEEEAEIAHQYDLMKLRIQFLYENVGTSYIEAIFSSASFSEAVEKVQYLLQISNYDRDVMVKVQGMLDQVKTDKATVEDQIAVIEDEMAEIEILQDAQEAQEELYAEVQSLQEEKLAEQVNELESSEAILDAFYAEIAENEARINEIMAEFEAEQERLREEAEAEYWAEVEARQQELINQAEEEGWEVTQEDLDAIEDEVPYNGGGGSDGFIWPCPGYYTITSYFGPRYDSDVLATGASDFHQGVDIYCPEGTPLVAIADGKVVSSYYSGGIGYTVIIYHGDGIFSEYHHMCQYAVVGVGETVYQGEVVGYSGQTGQYCTGPHLHFGMSAGSDAYALANFINPLNYY